MRYILPKLDDIAIKYRHILQEIFRNKQVRTEQARRFKKLLEKIQRDLLPGMKVLVE